MNEWEELDAITRSLAQVLPRGRTCTGCEESFISNPKNRRYCDRCTAENRPQQVRIHRLRYGLEPSDYLRLRERSGGLCEACGCSPTEAVDGALIGRLATSLHVDHCHETGLVRGLLCRECNYALEKAKEDPLRLQGLAAYITTYGASSTSRSRFRNSKRFDMLTGASTAEALDVAA